MLDFKLPHKMGKAGRVLAQNGIYTPQVDGSSRVLYMGELGHVLFKMTKTWLTQYALLTKMAEHNA